MPRETKAVHSEETVSMPEVLVAADSVAEPGKYKLMAFYLVQGKYFLYQVANPKNVVAVAPADVEFTVGEQELSADVLSKETSKKVFIPDSVANNLDTIRSFVLP